MQLNRCLRNLMSKADIFSGCVTETLAASDNLPPLDVIAQKYFNGLEAALEEFR